MEPTLEHIIAQIEALPRPYIDRLTVQTLFGVGRRRAQQILAPCITDHVGSNGLANRIHFIEHLRRLGRAEDVEYEQARRRKVASVLDRVRRSWLEEPRLLVEAPTAVLNHDMRDLPAGVTIQPGRITVECQTVQQALENLLCLAMAIGNDLDRFEQLIRPVR